MSLSDLSSELIDSAMYILGPFKVLHSLPFGVVGALSVDVTEFYLNGHSRIEVALWNQIQLNHVTPHFFVDIYFFLGDNFTGFIKCSRSF